MPRDVSDSTRRCHANSVRNEMSFSLICRGVHAAVEGITEFHSRYLRKSAKLAVPPSTLLANPRDTYYIPRPTKRHMDSPLATLYRIYWAIVMDDTITMRNEIESFWGRKGLCWKVENIPKPPDSSTER